MEIEIPPRWIDWIVAAMVVESVGLGLWLRRVGSAPWIAPLALYLASGVGLLLALRASMAHASHSWIALALLASLVAHLASLVRCRGLVAGARRPFGLERPVRRVAGP